MNCVQGDLAIISKNLRPGSPNAGKIVRCLRWVEVPPEGLVLPNVRTPSGAQCCLLGSCWEVDTLVTRWFSVSGSPSEAVKIPYIFDESLTPIRDSPEADETMKWAPKLKERMK